jgi:hypothetical protein
MATLGIVLAGVLMAPPPHATIIVAAQTASTVPILIGFMTSSTGGRSRTSVKLVDFRRLTSTPFTFPHQSDVNP